MEAERKTGKEPVCCPYCELAISEASLPFCQACKVKVFFCPECKKPVSRDDKKCPHCGESWGKCD